MIEWVGTGLRLLAQLFGRKTVVTVAPVFNNCTVMIVGDKVELVEQGLTTGDEPAQSEDSSPDKKEADGIET